MKKLPKRDGYKPRPRQRCATAEETIIDALAPLIASIAKDSGVEVPETFAKRRERKGRTDSGAFTVFVYRSG